MHKAIKYFERAIEVDPQYAVAYAGLADGYATLGAYQLIPPPLAASKTWPAIQRAIELDPTLAEPHASTGCAHLYFSDDWAQGEPHFRRSLELDPRNSTAHVYFGIFLAMSDRARESIDHILEARRLDPLSSFIDALSGLAYRCLGDHDAAIATLENALDIDSNSALAQWLLAFSYRDTGRIDEAVALAEGVAAATNRHPTFLSMAGHMYAVSGRHGEAMAIMEEIEAQSADGYVSPLSGVLIHSALGNMGELVPYVETVCEDGGGALTLFTTVRSDLAKLRDDPIAGPTIRRLPLWPEPSG